MDRPVFTIRRSDLVWFLAGLWVSVGVAMTIHGLQQPESPFKSVPVTAELTASV